MKKASITDAKKNLSALIAGLKNGAPVLILDRGRPVARLEPVTAGGELDDADARLARLVRAGLVRPGGGPIPEALFRTPPPRAKRGASILAALLEERREGR